MAAKRSKKVSNFEEWKKIEKVDLSYIPGRERRKEDARSMALRLRKQREEEERKLRSKNDWTPTDQFGNLDISVGAQVRSCLEPNFEN
jgi:hypothetical protein